MPQKNKRFIVATFLFALAISGFCLGQPIATNSADFQAFRDAFKGVLHLAPQEVVDKFGTLESKAVVSSNDVNGFYAEFEATIGDCKISNAPAEDDDEKIKLFAYHVNLILEKIEPHSEVPRAQSENPPAFVLRRLKEVVVVPLGTQSARRAADPSRLIEGLLRGRAASARAAEKNSAKSFSCDKK